MEIIVLMIFFLRSRGQQFDIHGMGNMTKFFGYNREVNAHESIYEIMKKCHYLLLALPPPPNVPRRNILQDGFLTLIIPMIRHMGGLPVWVHSRRVPLQDGEEGERWDLRVKVELEGGGFGAGMVEKGSQSRQPQAGGPGGEGGPLSGRIEQQLSRMQLREMRRQKSHATR